MPTRIAVLLALLLLLLLCAVATGIVGFVASQRLVRVADTWYVTALTVLAIGEGTITLPRTDDTEVAGTFGVTWQGNFAVVEEITARDARTVTRRVLRTTAPLRAGLVVEWNVFVYHGDPLATLGLGYAEVHVPSQLGPLPAWYLPGTGDTWVLLLHGIHSTREEGLRVLPALTRAGLPVLDLCYRNDVGAPRSPDGFYHLGDTEWQDVEAGVRYALDRGARGAIVFGWSTGACLIETFLRRSPLAAHARAAVLDSPALDWHLVIGSQLRKVHVPRWLAYVAAWFIKWRTGTDLARLSYIHAPSTVTTPTLLIHGTSDTWVPIAIGDAFARQNPARVTYWRVEGAEHTQGWNVGPAAYDDTLIGFLGAHACTSAGQPRAHPTASDAAG